MAVGIFSVAAPYVARAQAVARNEAVPNGVTPLAEALKVQAGEIRLEGTLQSMAVDGYSLVLNVVSFTLPSGKFSRLTASKAKNVLVGATTVVRAQGDPERAISLPDIKPGQAFVVIGKDEGSGKPILARVIAVRVKTSVSRGVASNPGADVPTASTAPVPTKLPLSQTRAGYTLTLQEMGFAPLYEILGIQRNSFQELRKHFFLKYAWTMAGDKPPLPPGKTLDNYLEPVRLFSPRGEDVGELSSSGGNTRGYANRTWSVSLYWKQVTAEFVLRDPAAPPGINGVFSEEVALTDLPVPRQAGQPQQVNRTVTTAHGAKFVLETVTAQSSGDGQVLDRLRFEYHWENSPQLPDLNLKAEMSDLVDKTGASWRPSSWGSGGNGLRSYLTLDRMPPPTIETVTLKLRVEENAPSLQQPRYLHRFRFPLQLPPFDLALYQPSPADLSLNQLGSGHSDHAQAEFEGRTFAGSNGYFDGYLWLRDRVLPGAANAAPDDVHDTDGTPDDHARRWLVQSVKVRDAAGQEYKTSIDSGDNNPLYFKLNGMPAAPNEHVSRLGFRFNQTLPDKVTLEATVTPAQRLHHIYEFPVVPVPAPGQTVPLNLSLTDDDGATITLREARQFQNTQELPGVTEAIRQYLPQSGVAITIAIDPVMELAATTEFRATAATDAEGRELLADRLRMWGGNLLQGGQPSSKQWTLLLPPTSSKSYRLRFVLNEMLTSNRTETITIPDISIQAIKP